MEGFSFIEVVAVYDTNHDGKWHHLYGDDSTHHVSISTISQVEIYGLESESNHVYVMSSVLFDLGFCTCQSHTRINFPIYVIHSDGKRYLVSPYDCEILEWIFNNKRVKGSR